MGHNHKKTEQRLQIGLLGKSERKIERFKASFATSQDCVKGKGLSQCLGMMAIARRQIAAAVEDLPALPPFGSVFDDPVGKGLLEANIMTGLLRFDPFMLQNLFALGLELPVKRGVLQ
jgi:hypothetical protein